MLGTETLKGKEYSTKGNGDQLICQNGQLENVWKEMKQYHYYSTEYKKVAVLIKFQVFMEKKSRTPKYK